MKEVNKYQVEVDGYPIEVETTIAEAKEEKHGSTATMQEGGAKEPIVSPEDTAPLTFDAGTASLLPGDIEMLTALQPKPKQDYALAGADLFSNISGKGLALLTEEKKRNFEKHLATTAGRIGAENVLYGLNEKGELYNKLTAYEYAFIIALRVLLSDSTVGRHALIEGKRKDKTKHYEGDINNDQGIDFFGACQIRSEAYDIYVSKEKSAYYDRKELHPNARELALLRLGFTPTDITVVIDKNTFIQDYLGGTKGGKQTKAFDAALSRLRSGKVAFVNTSSTKDGIKLYTDSLLRRTASFYGKKKGQKVEYHVISLHPAFARIFTPNYITYPANNADILGAILNVRNGADGLLSLYDMLLGKAAHNYGAIESRPGVQVFTIKESEVLPLLTTETQLRKNRKEVLERLYSDTGVNLFYTVGLLADRVTPPTDAQRKAAAAEGKDVEIEIHYKRVAATNCNL